MLWGFIQSKTLSHEKERKHLRFSCVFPKEPLPRGRAQQNIQNSHSGQELEKKGPCYLRREV